MTRDLSYSVNVDERLREFVLTTVMESGTRAVCPSYGVDLAPVVRHAARARERRRKQDVLLNVARGLIVAGAAVAWLSASIAVAIGGVVVAAGLAWAAVTRRVYGDLTAAVEVGRDGVDVPVPPLDAPDERRLAEVGKAQVVIYSQGENDPFIGSGRRMHSFQLHPIDLTRPGLDDNGDPKPLLPFTAADLHAYLAWNLPAKGPTGVTARDRLYVRGDYVHLVPGLLPDRKKAPSTTVPPDLLQAGLLDPTEVARTFLCVEHSMRGGDIVVCMYVRAWIDKDLLSIERLVYLLPPLRPRFRVDREQVSAGRPGAVANAVGEGFRCFLGALAFVDTDYTMTSKERRDNEAEKAKAARAIRAGFENDYGSRVSLREAVASYDTSEFNEQSDVDDSTRRLQIAFLGLVEEFLDDHGVELSKFRDQVKVINNYTIDTVQGGNVVVGGESHIITGHGQINTPQQQDQQNPQKE
ncbi:hypothetical protein LO762_08865 [Actinocorallia sp. API 0066]|uniref:hypothetical protein n=1 Tax=Actinocorallia sp. API 0066 TaxID=2896846 RepID=UPI001E46D7E6|nr:hypothetical protein [Actinocorallia sp. API 0066]MCD0449297.1 hypothetical protein [Actinocorallia sp. API 0066]